jgi:hypothetical protein
MKFWASAKMPWLPQRWPRSGDRKQTMFVKPENWNQLSPEEKRKLRLDHWEKSEGLEFVSPRAEAN